MLRSVRASYGYSWSWDRDNSDGGSIWRSFGIYTITIRPKRLLEQVKPSLVVPTGKSHSNTIAKDIHVHRDEPMIADFNDMLGYQWGINQP